MSDSGLIQWAALILGVLFIGIAIIEFIWHDRWELQKKVLSFVAFIILIYIAFFIIIFIVFSPGCVIGKGIIVQPFEVSGDFQYNISGKHLANSLCFELTSIGKVKYNPDRLDYTYTTPIINRTGDIRVRRDVEINAFPGDSPHDRTSPAVSSFSGLASLREYDSYQVGKVDMSGVSLSLDQIIPFLKKLTHNQGGLITGSFQRHGSTLYIVSNYYDPDSKGQKNNAWRVSRKLKENESVDDVIPTMVGDLAYMIELDVSREYDRSAANYYPQTWQAYKNLTMGWVAYHQYNSTRDNNDLETAGLMALSAKSSEPHCLGTDELLKCLKYTWNSKGFTLYNLGEYDAALRCFDKVIETDKNIIEINHQAESA